MPDQKPVVARGVRVTLHFSLSLTDGTEIDSNFDQRPAQFTVGDGSLLPGFESALTGMTAGESISITLPAAEAFGEVNPANVQTFNKERFAALLANSAEPVSVGTVLAFADGAGNDIPGVVQSLDDELMLVDFNHPLAGRDIDFTAHILNVVPAGVQVVEIQ